MTGNCFCTKRPEAYRLRPFVFYKLHSRERRFFVRSRRRGRTRRRSSATSHKWLTKVTPSWR